MKNTHLVCATLVYGIVAALFLSPFTVASQKAITLDDCFVNYTFFPGSGPNFQYLKDGMHYVEADGKGLHVHDVRDEKKDSLIQLDLSADARRYDQFDFSADEKKMLLRTRVEHVYRHSVLARYFVYDFVTRKTIEVHEAEKQQFVEFSPDARHIAFVSGNNVYIRDLENGEVDQVTRDGERNKIINGLPDWLYEEEFSPVSGEGMVALKWSPDGSKIAYIRFDERQVPEFPLTRYEGDVYPQRSTFKYPKVGSPNSVVSVHMYDVDAGSQVGQVMGLETDDYVPRIHWTADNQLVVTRLNRRQDTLELLLALSNRVLYDDEDQTNWIPVRPLLRETDSAYVDIHDNLAFLDDRQHFLWSSEQNGYNHLYLYGMDGKMERALTAGAFELTAFYGLDEKNGKFYYQIASPGPLDRQVWEGDLNGGAARLLSPEKGTAEAAFSPDFEYFTLEWSDANTPPVVTLRKRSGELVRTFTDNERVRKLRDAYGFSKKEFFTFRPYPAAAEKDKNELMLNGWMIKPPYFDSTRQYPVLFDIYGGPGSQTVQNQYNGYVGTWHQMLAQKGYIIVSVDNRGTGGRGRDFKKCTQLQLGKLETEDQIAAARYLGSLPYVDAGRIGIWGWSFGGFLSTSCILKGNDVFKMAMAVAPVTNWKWYDSAYTERFMRTTKDNEAGYEENSPIHFIDRLRGNNYLVCHGTTDDNVHWQQTVEMINALIDAGKSFETLYYPNRNHGIYGYNATRHLFTKLTSYVMEKL
ncbi:MAG: S9 family peptidase [Saprospiraceae bacterium]|nr:S9 family peptidase [Saprospiraceae bacterium]